MAITNKKLWFLEFPTYRYKEDVKKLAAKNYARIIDAKFRDQYSENTLKAMEINPNVTLKPEFAKEGAKTGE